MDKFINLVKNQFVYGGQKYALSEQRESTDVLFDKYGANWLYGTIDKYTFRYRNLSRERDLLKIACYMYILWLKKGYHVTAKGINDPAIYTNVTTKNQYFDLFISKVKDYIKQGEKHDLYTYYFGRDNETRLIDISNILGVWSKTKWYQISDEDIMGIFVMSYLIWKEKFENAETHDTDTNNQAQ